MSMTKCKECGQEVSSKAKKCPGCGVDTRNWFMRHKVMTFLGGFILLFTVMAIAGAGGKSKDKSASATDSSSSQVSQQEEQPISKEGVSSDVKITVLNSETKETIGGNKYSKKQAQGIFKIVTVSLSNNQKDAITIDSNSFVLIDKKGREFSYSSEAQFALGSSSGKNESFFLKKLNPGLSIEGTIVFDVPKDAESLILNARGGMTGKKIKLKID